MTDSMQTLSDLLPSPITAISDPWLGVSDAGAQLAALAAWSAVALLAIAWLVRRGAA
jgi:hypothetical protein